MAGKDNETAGNAMIREYQKEIILLDKPVDVRVLYTGAGIQILLAGGNQGHIGAVTVADFAGQLSTIVFPGHKESILTEKWAKAFYEKYRQPVVASAGIHYDGLSREGIEMVVTETENLLKEILK